MKRRFVLIIDNATKEQQNAVTNHFKEKLGYWHWFSDAWLLTDANGQWSVSSIRDKVQELLPGVDMIVLRVESDVDWAGFGAKDKFDWLHSTWKG